MRYHTFRAKYIYILHIIIVQLVPLTKLYIIGTFNDTCCDFHELFRYIVFDTKPERRM